MAATPEDEMLVDHRTSFGPHPLAASAHENDQPTQPVEKAIACWCSFCQAYLFSVPNFWRAVSNNHIQNRKLRQDDIQQTTTIDNVEFKGRGELDGCVLQYLSCVGCNTKIGLHCTRATREKRYSKTPFFRTNKVVLKQDEHAPEVPFNVAEPLQKKDSNGENSVVSVGSSIVLQPKEQREESETLAQRLPSPDDGDLGSTSVGALANNAPVPSKPSAQLSSSRPQRCQTCAKRKIRCGGRRPVCEPCERSNKICEWKPSEAIKAKLNLHALEEPTSFQSNSAWSESSSDDGVEPIPVRRQTPSLRGKREPDDDISRKVQDQQITIDKQQATITQLIDKVSNLEKNLNSVKQDAQKELLILTQRIIEAERRTTRQPIISGSVQDDAKAIPRRSRTPNLARRGGLSINGPSGLRKSFPETSPRKPGTSAANGWPRSSQAGSESGKASVVGGKPDMGSDGAEDFDRSLYDATPPPESASTPSEHADSLQESQKTPGLFMTQRTPTPFETQLTLPGGQASPVLGGQETFADAVYDAATQEYLRRTVRVEDPDDSDFEPGDDDSDHFQRYEPRVDSVASSIDRLLTPARPLQTSPKSKHSDRGRGSRRPRGRPPLSHRPLGVSHADIFSQPFSQSPTAQAVPSFQGPRPGLIKRGVGGRVRRVTQQLGRRSGAGVHPSTPPPDRDSKRQRLDGPVSYTSAFTPLGKEKGKHQGSSRYPNGRVRDDEGFLLTSTGKRDLRSVRGRALGADAFKRKEGEDNTTGNSSAQYSTQSLSSSQSPAPNLSTPTPLQPARGAPVNGNSSAAPNGARPIEAPEVVDNDTTSQQKAAEPKADLATQVILSEQEKLRKAYGKGTVKLGKEYSDKHKAIMARLRL